MWLDLANPACPFRSIDEGSRANRALAHWCASPAQDGPGPSFLVVAAHPDDDVLGLGGRLHALRNQAAIAYLSDGAPLNPRFFREAGFETRAAYAVARSREAQHALQLAGIPKYRVFEFGFPDQSLAYQLVPLTRHVICAIVELCPEIVLTHPYEGGHPDHDATAFAVQAAVRTLEAHGIAAPVLLEFTSYHQSEGELVFGQFAPRRDLSQCTLVLDPKARQQKLAMLRCHASQYPFLQRFPLESESFRVAPRYDFEQPPSPAAFYDSVDWGITSEKFVQLAQAALGKLGLKSRC